MSAPPIILASTSPRRHDLLTLIGVSHEVIPSDVDETLRAGETPAAYAERLARAKAGEVAGRRPEAITIGADTIVVIDGQILGKPRDRSDAVRMLRTLSGRSHSVYTAVAVARGAEIASVLEVVGVTFRPLDDHDIAAYIDTGEPMDKAGAYGIQGYGATIVERIDGDYFAVMGLALGRTVRLLARVGIAYEFGRLRDVSRRAPRSSA